MKIFNSLILIILSVFMLSACGKKVQIEGGSGSSSASDSSGGSGGPISSPITAPTDPACNDSNTKTWTYTQPTQKTKKMDLLFVVDTSGSIWNEYTKIRKQISSYMGALPSGVDLNIGILPGHGPFSIFSGKLHAAAGGTKFIHTKSMSSADVEKQLEKNFKSLPFDITPGGGEYLMHSLNKALSGDHLKKLKSEGFLRNDAVLTVVFVSDENDVCFNPKKHGYDSFPDYVPSITGLDEVGYKIFCKDKNGDEKYPADKMMQLASKVKGGNRYMFGAITHFDKNKVPHGKFNEDSIGHGYVELLQSSSPKSVGIEITDDDYSDGLAKLAKIGSGDELLTKFTFKPLSRGEIHLVSVTVDGHNVPFEIVYNDDHSVTVVLRTEDAGTFGSSIVIKACTY